MVAYLGEMDAADRVGLKMAAQGRKGHQQDLFDGTKPEWVEVDVRSDQKEDGSV